MKIHHVLFDFEFSELRMETKNPYNSSSSAEIVADIEELLKQILVRVPALSLIRFQCVSKHWLSLISDPEFRCRHTLRNPNPKISAFFSRKTQDDSFKSTPAGWNPFKTLNNSVPDGSNLRIFQSCNGLFLCHIPINISIVQTKHHPVYLVNPTTNHFRALCSPSVNKFSFNSSYGLAFDPSKSPHHKVVCVTSFDGPCYDGESLEIDVYSSETGEWKHLDTPDLKHFGWTSREGALYCNGAIHWIRDSADAGFHWRGRIGDDASGRWMRDEDHAVPHFDICEEQLRLAPANLLVPLFVQNTSVKDFGIFPTGWPRLFHRHFGESGGCLYFIETNEHCSTRFEVLEMERDYFAWLVKYYVDLNPLVAALPGQDWNAFVILGLSQEEGTSQELEFDDLLLHFPGKVISYNLLNKTFKTSVE